MLRPDGGSELRVRDDAKAPWRTILTTTSEDEADFIDFAADGTAYYLCMNTAAGNSELGQYVYVSTTGGQSWATPVLAITIVVWQLLCSSPKSSLPAPSKVLADSWDFIVDPFYDNGGIDKGAFWHLSKSLSRVAVGFLLSAVVGIALGGIYAVSALGLVSPPAFDAWPTRLGRLARFEPGAFEISAGQSADRTKLLTAKVQGKAR